MDRSEIIKRVLAKIEKDLIDHFIIDLKKIYQINKKENFSSTKLPSAILKYIGNFMDEHDLDQSDKLAILAEVKRNNFLNFNLNKNLERAWRIILKKWNLSSYRLEG